ncbi:MAG: transposase [Bacteroidetes bacterium]|nr:transposase [Bacteroidota bacterium]
MIDKLPNINQWRKAFLIETLILFMSIRGRINFLQLARYGKYKEQRYRQQFEKPFDFLAFNKELTLSHGSGRYVIAFDPSYVNKSGKHTPGVGYFWSGCANRAKWGLEIGGLAAIDIDNHTAYHLEAIQTLNTDDQNLTDWYAEVISERADTLTSISRILVADAWFSKKPFADHITKADMHLISRLRDDADLKYLNMEPPTGKRGRPSKYSGKINNDDIDKEYFRFISSNEQETVYAAVVYSKALKRNIMLVHVTYLKESGKDARKLYYSTDVSMDPQDVLLYYRSRFQIEFLYRDGKQHTGMNDSQARSENKLHFQFNASLTSINIAKAIHWLSIPKQDRGAFSMSDIKTMNHNILMLNRFFDVFGISPYSTKNQNYVKELILYGTIAA